MDVISMYVWTIINPDSHKGRVGDQSNCPLLDDEGPWENDWINEKKNVQNKRIMRGFWLEWRQDVQKGVISTLPPKTASLSELSGTMLLVEEWLTFSSISSPDDRGWQLCSRACLSLAPPPTVCLLRLLCLQPHLLSLSNQAHLVVISSSPHTTSAPLWGLVLGCLYKLLRFHNHQNCAKLKNHLVEHLHVSFLQQTFCTLDTNTKKKVELSRDKRMGGGE